MPCRGRTAAHQPSNVNSVSNFFYCDSIFPPFVEELDLPHLFQRPRLFIDNYVAFQEEGVPIDEDHWPDAIIQIIS